MLKASSPDPHRRLVGLYESHHTHRVGNVLAKRLKSPAKRAHEAKISLLDALRRRAVV